MNDALRALSLSEGMAVAGTAVPVFNEAFLNNVRKRGRIHELGLMATFKLRSRRLWDDVDKAPSMLSKGKLPLRGSRVGGRSEREELFRRAVSEAAAEQAAASRDEAAADADGDS